MSSSIPVNPEKGQASQAGDWGSLSDEGPQEGVYTPVLTLLCSEGSPVGFRHSKLIRKNPDKIVGESDGPEDLGH